MVRITKEQSEAIERISKELSCPVCERLLDDPYTTDCGHHFCKNCIDESLFKSSHCPQCNLPQFPVSLKKNTSFANLVRSHNEIKLYLSLLLKRSNGRTNVIDDPVLGQNASIQEVIELASQSVSLKNKGNDTGQGSSALRMVEESDSQPESKTTETSNVATTVVTVGSTLQASGGNDVVSQTAASTVAPTVKSVAETFCPSHPGSQFTLNDESHLQDTRRSSEFNTSNFSVPDTQQINEWKKDLEISKSMLRRRDTATENDTMSISQVDDPPPFTMGKLGDSQCSEDVFTEDPISATGTQQSLGKDGKSDRNGEGPQHTFGNRHKANIPPVTDSQTYSGNQVSSVPDTQEAQNPQKMSVDPSSTHENKDRVGVENTQNAVVDTQQTVGDTQFTDTCNEKHSSLAQKKTGTFTSNSGRVPSLDSVQNQDGSSVETQLVPETQVNTSQSLRPVPSRALNPAHKLNVGVSTFVTNGTEEETPKSISFASPVEQQAEHEGMLHQKHSTSKLVNIASDRASVTTQVRIAPTGLTLTEIQAAEKIAMDLGWQFCSRFDDPYPTHLIAKCNHIRVEEQEAITLSGNRSLKYLLGLTHGCWIVDQKWLSVCLAKKARVNEQPFEVNYDPSHGFYLPRIARERLTLKKPKLLDGYRVYIGPWEQGVEGSLGSHQVAHLLTWNGAKVLSTKKWVGKRAPRGDELFPDNPALRKPFALINHPKLRILGVNGEKSCASAHQDCGFCANMLDWMRTHLSCDVLDAAWVIQCIVTQSTYDTESKTYMVSPEGYKVRTRYG